jgi:hypothetical protein
MDCSMHKSSSNLNLEKMDIIEAVYPWEIVGTNIILLLLFTNNNMHIIVFTDLFTKYTEAFTIAKMDTETIVEIYVREIVC